MKIPKERKEEIQWFVYFLFKGSLDNNLISNHSNYVRELIENQQKLHRCFEIFANCKTSGMTYSQSTHEVSDYIIKDDYNTEICPSPFWREFLNVSKTFCFNEFELPISAFKLDDLDGCGTDAVPFFAVWTNNIEIDEEGECLNKTHSLKRANERLLLDDPNYIIESFSEEELEQEIY